MPAPPATTPAGPAEVAPAQSTKRHWIVALGGFFVMIGGSVPLSGLSFFHPYVIKELFPRTQSVFLLYYTLTLFAIVLSMMFIGRSLLPRIGTKKMMYIGSVVVALGLVAFSFGTSNPLTFFGAGILLGLGYGISFQLVPIVWVNNWFVQKKGTALGLVMGGTGLGGALWAFLVPALSASPGGWRRAYLVAAAVVLLFAPLATLLLVVEKPSDVGLTPLGASVTSIDANAPAAVQPGFAYRQAIRNGWVWLVYASVLVMGLVHGGAQILAVYLQTEAGKPGPNTSIIYGDLAARQPSETAFFSMLMTVWTIGLIVFKPLLGFLNDKMGILGAMLLTLGMQSLTFLWLPQMQNGQLIPLMFLAMFFMAAGMSNGTVQPPLLVAGAVGPRDFAKIWSFLGTGYLLGMAIGAPLWGVIRDTFGSYVPGFYAAPVLLILLSFVGVFAMKRGHAAYTKGELA